MTVRVRFAPSPTGKLHIGGVRTALFNFLFARNQSGVFILRIEDTDRLRSRDEFTEGIQESLRWLGLAWDEGPFFQSRRTERYDGAIQRLVDQGTAYIREDAGKGEAVVFKIPREPVEFEDLVHGRIGIDLAKDPDLVIRKSDGSPTYNFACVVDDADMGITHVIRGDDHIYNTPKQIAVYRALGLTPPRYAHIPLILNPDGTKMSKRDDVPAFALDYRELGYLPEALVNFLALLGWSPGNDLELMSMADMTRLFSLDRINRSPARFFLDKLNSFNKHYLKQRSLEELLSLGRPFLERAYDLSGVPAETVQEAVRLNRDRIERLSDLVELARFALVRDPPVDPRAEQKHLGREGADEVLRRCAELFRRLQSDGDFTGDRIESGLKAIAEATGRKMGEVAQPVRVAVTGIDRSPPIHETLLLIGPDETVRRIERALQRIDAGRVGA
jgi:glutamyl-tRNA synthetase